MTEIETIKKALLEITTGIWWHYQSNDSVVCDPRDPIFIRETIAKVGNFKNAYFIANAPTWLSFLLTTIESLQTNLDDAEMRAADAIAERNDLQKLIEAQQQEIKRLNICQNCGGSGINELCHDPYYAVPCECTVDWMSEVMRLNEQVESQKEEITIKNGIIDGLTQTIEDKSPYAAQQYWNWLLGKGKDDLESENESLQKENKQQRKAIEESFEWISPSSYAYELLKNSLSTQEGDK